MIPWLSELKPGREMGTRPCKVNAQVFMKIHVWIEFRSRFKVSVAIRFLIKLKEFFWVILFIISNITLIFNKNW